MNNTNSFFGYKLYVLETFLSNSSTFLNPIFWEILNKRPSEMIRSDIAILRQVPLEVIYFWSLPSIPKRRKPFETFLELLSVFIFDAEMKV